MKLFLLLKLKTLNKLNYQLRIIKKIFRLTIQKQTQKVNHQNNKFTVNKVVLKILIKCM